MPEIYNTILSDSALKDIRFADGDRELGYEKVFQIASRLSPRIGGADASDQPVIGVALPRGIEIPMIWLAAWILGATILPLNPTWPRARIQAILEKVEPTLLVVNDLDEFDFFQKKVALPEIFDTIAPSPDIKAENLRGLKPHDIAYIVFTSGSTGEPKGVAISALAFKTYIDWTKRYFHDFRDTRCLLIVSEFSFDIALGDVAFALAFGCNIMVAKENKNIPAIAATIERNNIEVLYSAPNTHAGLTEFASRKATVDLSSLRLILSGGDKFPWKTVERYSRVSTRAEFYNMYGPTELTINCFATRLDDKLSLQSRYDSVPIGECFDHLDHRLIDDSGLVAKRGELCVAGPQVMSGYYGDAELSKSKLVKDPLSKNLDRNLYRTGDLAETVGGLTFLLGRVDSLVKIKGYRVHPDEVATALAEHPEVANSAVVAVTRNAEVRLLALVVPTSAGPTPVAKLLEFLGEKLPSYMLPAQFEFLGELPLNASGKVDRKALTETYGEE